MSSGDVWTEVRLRVQPEGVEAVADLLREQTGAGVAIEPAIEALGPDEGYVESATGPVMVKAYLFGPVPASRRRSLREALRARGLTAMLLGPLRWLPVREVDWAETWKEHYQVERVGRVVVRPAWRDYAPGPGETVVSLDPGMAFGTGQHPTTRMCLAALQELLQTGDVVLDLGTGSGILALAAAALGAGRCLALDRDEQAVKAARSNVALNAAEALVEVRRGSVEAGGGERYDLVLANINAATVSDLAGDLWRALRSGGTLVAGGIIREQEGRCTAALTSAGLRVDRTLAEGEWRTLVARRA